MNQSLSFLDPRHLEARQQELIAHARKEQITIAIEDVSAASSSAHVVNFQGAFWLVRQARRTEKSWFGKTRTEKYYTFDINFDTLFLQPGKLILKGNGHPTHGDFEEMGVHVEPVKIQI